MPRSSHHATVCLFGWKTLFPLLGILIQTSAWAGSDTLLLTITAEVVSQPCSLRPGDETIQVDFGGIVNKVLLRDGRTPGKLFQLHLEECDPAIANSVKVTFAGQGASENNSLLALAGDSAAKGIAIGLEQGGASVAAQPGQPSAGIGKRQQCARFHCLCTAIALGADQPDPGGVQCHRQLYP